MMSNICGNKCIQPALSISQMALGVDCRSLAAELEAFDFERLSSSECNSLSSKGLLAKQTCCSWLQHVNVLSAIQQDHARETFTRRFAVIQRLREGFQQCTIASSR